MENKDIELCSTEELIEELINRSTFAGIIIKATDEIKSFEQSLDKFEIIIKGISEKDTKIVLNLIQENINDNL